MKHILLVEDEAAHAELIQRGLSRGTEEFKVTTFRNLQEARTFLTQQTPDLVLADYRLPDGRGDSLVHLVAKTIPVILLTAYGSERAAVEAIQAGALDYVVKSPEAFADMVHVVERALRAWEHLAERRKAEHRLELLNRCLLSLGPDFQSNVWKLVAFLGQELSASMSLYNRRKGDEFEVAAHWQLAPGFPLHFPVQGSMCQQVVERSVSEALCIPDLLASEFAASNPIFKKLNLRAYAGHVVTCAGKSVGSLCLFFDHVCQPSDQDLRLLAILALALSSEENRHESERRLRESERQYRELFELAPSNIVVLDTTGRVIDANPAFCQRMGFDRRELIGKPVNQFSQESKEQVQANIQKLLSGEVLEHIVTNVRKDGSRRHYELRETAIRLSSGEQGILAISNDITERTQFEEALERLAAGAASRGGEGFFELLVRNLAGALGTKYALVGEIVGSDRVRTLTVWAGDGFRANFEYDLAGTPCWKVMQQSLCIYPDHVAEEFPKDQMLGQMGVRGYMGARLFDNQHRPLGILAVLHDQPIQVMPKAESILSLFATRAGAEIQRIRSEKERLEMERRLLHAQKLESLGVLAGGIAHDFNNLLTAILGNLEITQMDLDESSPAQNSLREAAVATRRAADLTRQMLAYSGRGRFVIKLIDLSELVEEMAQLLKVSIAKTATLQLQLDRRLPQIEVDPAQVQQVVMNLITNASEALDDQVGSIRIETGTQECDATYLAQSRLAEKASPGEYVYLEVTDTGCGMDDNVQQRLFDPFFTTKFTGRGLGMSAVLGMVRGHGGAIMVSSAVGRGTTIRVLFPTPKSRSSVTDLGARKGPAANAPATQMSGTVLMAEDEEPVRNLLTRFLSRQGLRVLAAADGREAVKLFHEHASEITLAFLDVTMPELDGVAALAEMRRLRPDLKAVLTSGYDGQEIGRRYAEQGGAEFIQKPYRLDELQSLVKRLCSGKAAGHAS